MPQADVQQLVGHDKTAFVLIQPSRRIDEDLLALGINRSDGNAETRTDARIFNDRKRRCEGTEQGITTDKPGAGFVRWRHMLRVRAKQGFAAARDVHGTRHSHGQALTKIPRAIQFSNAIPMRASACAGWAANRRQAAAMLLWPAHLKSPMAVWRSPAITGGRWPQRTCERSASQVTSRTQCDLFSIAQGPRSG